MLLTRSLSAVALAATLAGAIGCAHRSDSPMGSSAISSSAPESDTEWNLREALAHIQANDVTRSYLEYMDNATVTEVIGSGAAVSLAVEAGLGSLQGRADSIGRVVGVDASRMRTRVVVGRSTDEAGLWLGDVDVAKVDAWFERYGGMRSESGRGTVWRTGEDRQPNDRHPYSALAPDGSFNVVRTAPGSFSWSRAAEPLEWFTVSGGGTLGADPSISSLATCLGDANIAIIERMESGLMYGVGVRISPQGDHSEVVCARSESPERVEAMRNSASRARDAGELPIGTEVAAPADSVVQLIWPTPRGFPTGHVWTMLRLREFDAIFGS